MPLKLTPVEGADGEDDDVEPAVFGEETLEARGPGRWSAGCTCPFVWLGRIERSGADVSWWTAGPESGESVRVWLEVLLDEPEEPEAAKELDASRMPSGNSNAATTRSQTGLARITHLMRCKLPTIYRKEPRHPRPADGQM
jgi:hypothetical protein